MRSRVCAQKLPPYDEFTVFGLPSDAGQVEKLGVRDCLTRDDGPRPLRPDCLVHPPKKLVRQIEDLEKALRPSGFEPPNRYDKIRPHTAHLMNPRLSPRAFQPAPRRETSGVRRPLTSVPAYRAAGLQPGSNALLPSTRASIEEWRTLPKYEEALLLGHLKSQKDRFAKAPLWKLRRYEFVPPRI